MVRAEISDREVDWLRHEETPNHPFTRRRTIKMILKLLFSGKKKKSSIMLYWALKPNYKGKISSSRIKGTKSLHPHGSKWELSWIEVRNRRRLFRAALLKLKSTSGNKQKCYLDSAAEASTAPAILSSKKTQNRKPDRVGLNCWIIMSVMELGEPNIFWGGVKSLRISKMD